MNPNVKKVLKSLGVHKLRDFTYGGVGKIAEKTLTIPQNYSFFVFGTHGVGFSALLYYISIANKQNPIYPTPLCALRADKQTLGEFANLITMRFYSHIYPVLLQERIKTWGLSFDGGEKSPQWILKNIQKSAPALLIVRDPIRAMLACINFNYYYDIFHNFGGFGGNQIDLKKLQLHTLSSLNAVIGFWSNLEPLLPKIEKLLILDTSDLIGDKAKETMRQIGEFLNLDFYEQEQFGESVNTPFQRSLPFFIEVDGHNFRISAFEGHYAHVDYWKADYCLRDQLFYINRDYRSPLFPNHPIFITLKKQVTLSSNTLEKLYIKIEEKLSEIKEKIDTYAKCCMTLDDLLYLLKKRNLEQKIAEKIRYETQEVFKRRPELSTQWKTTMDFLENVGK